MASQKYLHFQGHFWCHWLLLCVRRKAASWHPFPKGSSVKNAVLQNSMLGGSCSKVLRAMFPVMMKILSRRCSLPMRGEAFCIEILKLNEIKQFFLILGLLRIFVLHLLKTKSCLLVAKSPMTFSITEQILTEENNWVNLYSTSVILFLEKRHFYCWININQNVLIIVGNQLQLQSIIHISLR